MPKIFDEKKHQRKSIRLPFYDYSQNGAYFVTICTKNRACIFGKIENGEMIKNDLGEIAEKELLKTQEMRPNIFIDSFVIMPNHIHIIIRIDNPVGAYCNTPLQPRKFESPKNNLGSIVRGYKSAVTTYAKKSGFPESIWQRNYHEHIIRNEQSYEKIAEYIFCNPQKWNEDMFFVDF